MGIGYNDSIILFNKYENGLLGTELYFGTRFDNVRIELTQGANIRQSGIENADSCIVKIPTGEFPKAYLPPEVWNDKPTEEMEDYFTVDPGNDNFFVIVKKDNLNINIKDLPAGKIDSSTYSGGFLQYVKLTYGHTYMVHTNDVYELIPRFELGGS